MSNSILRFSFLFVIFLLSAFSTRAAEPAVDVTRMRCEYLVDPLGINETQPRLDWLITGRGETPRDLMQKSYHILVASSPRLLAQNKGDLWDSGEVASDATSQVAYAGSALTSRERCYWKVQSKLSNGESPWSKPAFFEMGLLKPEDWSAKWIDTHEFTAKPLALNGSLQIVSAEYGPYYGVLFGNQKKDVTDLVKGMVKDNALSVRASNDVFGGDPAPGQPKSFRVVYTLDGAKHEIWGNESATLTIPSANQDVPYLRKDFTVTKPIARACLYVTALGLYEVHLNGSRVGDHLLAPDWTDYSKRVRYQAYDVTGLLKKGPNALGAIIGNGWYAGHIGNGGFQAWGTYPALLAQLEVTHTDGTTETILSDASWRMHAGPILSSDFMMGEEYDATKEIAGWDKPGLDIHDWTAVNERPSPSIAIDDQVSQPVRQTGARPGTLMKEINGHYIYDLGQNMVGYVQLKVDEPAGTEITIRHAEMLNPDGTIYTANLRGAPSIDHYTCKGGGVETWHPHFTFHGFRYVEISGLTKPPQPDAVTGLVLGTDFPHVGQWACSYQPLNQLQSNIQWGMRGNYLSVPTDCPQRDERMGWMGDAEVFCRTGTYNGDVAAFFTKWLVDVDDAQEPDGQFTDICPNPKGAGGVTAGAPAWGDAGVIIPVTIYRAYGDKRLLHQHLPAMKRLVDYDQAHSTNLIRDHDRGNDYGDWLSQGENAPKDLIGTAFFGYSTALVAEACDAVGDPDAAKYHQLFGNIQKAFTQTYVRPDGHMTGDTQTGYAMAIRFNLVPDDLKPKIAQLLADDIKAHQDHLTSGFVGVSYLLPVLCQYNHVDEAYKLFEQDTFPSWLFSVKNGATTIWERWDGWRPDKGFQDPGMNSFNHYSLGSCGEWMFDTCAGIDPAAPGFKHIIIHPTPGGTLTEANATYDSINGKIAVKWTRMGSTFNLHVTVPINTTATIVFPGSDTLPVIKPFMIDGKPATVIPSGDYSFTCTLH